MTSEWRGGEGVWNWFGGGARGDDSRWIFARQTHSSPRRCFLQKALLSAVFERWIRRVSVGEVFLLLVRLYMCLGFSSVRGRHVHEGFDHSFWRVSRNERRQMCHAVVKVAKNTAGCSLWRNVRVFSQEWTVDQWKKGACVVVNALLTNITWCELIK